MEIKSCGGIMLFLEEGKLEKAIEFFRDVLGAKMGPDLDHLLRFGFRAKGAWIGTETPFRVELGEAFSDEPAMGRQMKKAAPCFNCLDVWVDNIDEAIAELRAKGVRVSDKLRIEDPRFEELYECMIHPKDAFGVIIELLEMKGKEPAPRMW